MGGHDAVLAGERPLTSIRWGRMPEVELRDVTVRLSGSTVLDGLSLEVEQGELFSLVGPSGCGKTTVLRLVAGLLSPQSGTVTVGGRPVSASEPWRNRVGMVFQDEALYEHFTVSGNLAFPGIATGLTRAVAERGASRLAGRLGIRRLLFRKPSTLSSGERGMVAAGRALGRDLSVLVLDEPLAKADRQVRTRFRSEVRRLHDTEGLTTLLATNDWEEAAAISDRIAVLDAGRLHQVGTPVALYASPVDLFVAGFAGLNPMNIMPGTVEAGDGGSARVSIGSDRILLDRAARAGRVLVGIRPEHLSRSRPDVPFERCLHGTVGLVEDAGSRWFVHFGLGEVGSAAFTASLDTPAPVSPGDKIEFAVTGRIHLFDPDTGRAL